MLANYNTTLRRVCWLVGIVIIVILSGPLVDADPPGLNPFPGVAPSEPGLRVPNRMVVTAVNDKTGEPMPGVQFEIKADGRGTFKKEFKVTTDDAGQCTVEFPPLAILTNFRMDAAPPGMVPIHINWTDSRHPLNLRSEYVTRFQPGTTIGGIVQDEHGAALPGSIVNILIPATDSDMPSYYYYVGKNIKSDAEGRWRCDTVPAKCDRSNIHAEHEGYLQSNISLDGNQASLRGLSLVTKLVRGATVTGRVVNARDEPVSGARILLGNSHYDHDARKSVTDDDGRFELNNCQTQPTLLVVQAEDYAPATQNIVLAQVNEPLVVRLGPPAVFRLHIVDADGEPVQGVSVRADRWHNHQILNSEFQPDKEGRVVWKSGPDEAVEFDFYGEQYMSQFNLPLKPSDEHTIVMYPGFEVRGTVDDAETGERVPNFKVLKAWSVEPKPNWDRWQVESGSGGQFTFKFDQFQKTYRMRIEADGYEPVESPDFTAAEPPTFFDFKLRKQPLVFGVILKPDGAPAEGASVVVLAKSDERYVSITAGTFRLNDGDESIVRSTGADGRFSFAPPNESFQVVATHETGYVDMAVRDLADMPPLKLEPWGRIQGTLKAGTKPVVNQQVQFRPDRPRLNNARINFSYTTHTNGQGHFALERIVPAAGRISEMVARTDGTYYVSVQVRWEAVRVEAGETTRIDIGGNGRPVIGRIAATNADGRPFDWAGNELGSVTPGILGIAFGQPRQFVVAADGTFGVDDLSPGEYQLTIPLTGPTIGVRATELRTLGTVRRQFTLPKIEEGRNDEPLDLGTIEAKVAARQQPAAGR